MLLRVRNLEILHLTVLVVESKEYYRRMRDKSLFGYGKV